MESTDYRVIPRRNAALYAVVLLAVLAGLVLAASGWIESYERYMTDLQSASREEAIAVLKTHLRTFALAQAVPIWALALFLVWQSQRAIATRSLPPVGSWIVEGQKIRTGASAVRFAWLTIALAVLLVLATTAAAVVVWNIADGFEAPGNETAAGAR